MHYRIILTVTALLLSLTGTTHAATTHINVYADGTIEDFTHSDTEDIDGVPDRISDTNSLLPARGIFTGFNVDAHAIMTFDISDYSHRPLSSAFLTGYGTKVDNAAYPDSIDGNFYIYYGGNGLVELDDFNTPGTFIGNVTFTPSSPFNLEYFQLDITSYLQELLNTNHEYAEFRVEAEYPTVYINAGETGPSSDHTIDPTWPGPQLALTFSDVHAVPEPGSLFLLGAALMGGGLCRRKKKT